VNLGTQQSHDLDMSQDTISAEVNKDVCEPFGCFKEATAKINLVYSLILSTTILKSTPFSEFKSSNR
jgi:hypothetical protein